MPFPPPIRRGSRRRAAPATVCRKQRSLLPPRLVLLAQDRELLDEKFSGHSHQRGVRRCFQFTFQLFRELRPRDG